MEEQQQKEKEHDTKKQQPSSSSLKETAAKDDVSPPPQQQPTTTHPPLSEETGSATTAKTTTTAAASRQRRSRSSLTATATTTTLWDQHYAKLLEFYQKHKHSNVPRKSNDDSSSDGNANLNKWIGQQRRPSVRAKLTDDQVAKLNAVDFQWKTKSTLDEEQWMDRYHRLRQYQRRFGTTDVPQKYPADPELGTWVANQRRRYNQGKLRPDRKVLLDRLTFTWLIKGGGSKMPSTSTVPAVDAVDINNNVISTTTASTSTTTPIGTAAYDAQWEVMYDKLCVYKKKHGHCNVSQNAEGNLGMWVSTQRRYYHKKTWMGSTKGLRPDRQAKLDAIGFEWTRQQRGRRKGLSGTATGGSDSNSSNTKTKERTQRDDNNDDDDDEEEENAPVMQQDERPTKRIKNGTTSIATSTTTIGSDGVDVGAAEGQGQEQANDDDDTNHKANAMVDGHDDTIVHVDDDDVADVAEQVIAAVQAEEEEQQERQLEQLQDDAAANSNNNDKHDHDGAVPV